MLDLDDGAINQIAFVEIGEGAIDHFIHLLVGDVFEVDDGRVLDFGQNGPLSNVKRGPFVMIACSYSMFTTPLSQRLPTCLGGQYCHAMQPSCISLASISQRDKPHGPDGDAISEYAVFAQHLHNKRFD